MSGLVIFNKGMGLAVSGEQKKIKETWVRENELREEIRPKADMWKKMSKKVKIVTSKMLH